MSVTQHEGIVTKASSSVVSMRLSVIAIVISLVAMFGGIAAGLFGSVALRSVLNAPIRSQMEPLTSPVPA